MRTRSVSTDSRRSNARRVWRVLATLTVALGAHVGLPLSGADASVIVDVAASFPDQVSTSTTGAPASVTVVNGSNAPHATGALTVTHLMLLPSCGNRNLNCEGGADPGVFELSSTGQGAGATGCAGRTFAISTADQSTGRLAMLPADGRPLALGAPGTTTDTCRIDFTFSTRRLPTVDASPQVEGMQTNQVVWMVGVYGDGSTGFDSGEDVTTVITPPPPRTDLLCVVLALLGRC